MRAWHYAPIVMSFSSSIVPKKAITFTMSPADVDSAVAEIWFYPSERPCEGHYSIATGLIPDHATQTDSHNDWLRNVRSAQLSRCWNLRYRVDTMAVDAVPPCMAVLGFRKFVSIFDYSALVPER